MVLLLVAWRPLVCQAAALIRIKSACSKSLSSEICLAQLVGQAVPQPWLTDVAQHCAQCSVDWTLQLVLADAQEGAGRASCCHCRCLPASIALTFSARPHSRARSLTPVLQNLLQPCRCALWDPLPACARRPRGPECCSIPRRLAVGVDDDTPTRLPCVYLHRCASGVAICCDGDCTAPMQHGQSDLIAPLFGNCDSARLSALPALSSHVVVTVLTHLPESCAPPRSPGHG